MTSNESSTKLESGDLGEIYYVNLESVCRRRCPGLDYPEFTTDFYSAYAGHGQELMGAILLGRCFTFSNA